MSWTKVTLLIPQSPCQLCRGDVVTRVHTSHHCSPRGSDRQFQPVRDNTTTLSSPRANNRSAAAVNWWPVADRICWSECGTITVWQKYGTSAPSLIVLDSTLDSAVAFLNTGAMGKPAILHVHSALIDSELIVRQRGFIYFILFIYLLCVIIHTCEIHWTAISGVARICWEEEKSWHSWRTSGLGTAAARWLIVLL